MCLFQYKFGLLRFIPHFSFSIAIAPLRFCFSCLKICLNDYCKCCFLVIKTFTLILFIGFSVNVPNIAMFSNLAFCLLIVYLLFLLLFANLFCVRNMALKKLLVWFLIVTLTLNKVLSFNNRVFVFVLLSRLGMSFLLSPREKLLLIL